MLCHSLILGCAGSNLQGFSKSFREVDPHSQLWQGPSMAGEITGGSIMRLYLHVMETSLKRRKSGVGLSTLARSVSEAISKSRLGILARSVSEAISKFRLGILARSVSEVISFSQQRSSLTLRVSMEKMSWPVDERTSRRCPSRWRTS